MTIKTKFEPGQEVWIMEDNKPIKVSIRYINIIAVIDIFNKITYEATYTLNNRNLNKFKEYEIYATKEDLKNSLFD